MSACELKSSEGCMICPRDVSFVVFVFVKLCFCKILYQINNISVCFRPFDQTCHQQEDLWLLFMGVHGLFLILWRCHFDLCIQYRQCRHFRQCRPLIQTIHSDNADNTNTLYNADDLYNFSIIQISIFRAICNFNV